MSKNLDELLKQLVNLHPKYIDLSHNRLLNILKKIGNPHLHLPQIIHIAGTNGKGSTLSYIRHILMENKLKIHAYISPHLEKFNERIIIANEEIKTKKLLETLLYLKKINNNKPITFFEITTAAAFYLFSKEKADFLILETGLGGRLDATNVIKKSLINIITPIGIDHQEFLGKNILNITDEKLGIIKKNSNVIIANQKSIVKMHIKKSLIKNTSDQLFFNTHFKIIEKYNNYFTLKFKQKRIKIKNPKLLGDHQIENASIAIVSILLLNELGYSFSEKIINKGIQKTKWPGRLEKGKLQNINVYLDGAHNIDGASQLLKYFKNKDVKVWLIIGMLNNKNLFGYLKKLKPIIEGVIPLSIPGEKNCFSEEEIVKVCKNLGLISFVKKSITKTNNFLLKEIKPKVILISGSLYLVGKIRNKYL